MESTTAGGADTRGLQEKAVKDLSEEIPFKDALMVALAAGLGYGFDAYAVNIYGLVLPAISASLGISAGTAGVIGSIFLVGYTIGTIGFGIAADKFGRKDTLGVSILMYGLTTSLGGLGGNVVWFTVMRFLTGIGGAGELAVGAPYTCEMFKSPLPGARDRRDHVLAVLARLHPRRRRRAGARAEVGLGGGVPRRDHPAFAVFAFRRFISESVRYVVDKADDKFSAAQELLAAEQKGGTAKERAAAVAETRAQGRGQGTSARPRSITHARRTRRWPAPRRPGRAARRRHRGAVRRPARGRLHGARRRPRDRELADHPRDDVAVQHAPRRGAASSGTSPACKQAHRHRMAALHRQRDGLLGHHGVPDDVHGAEVRRLADEAIEYAIMFYVLQFFVSYLGTGLSDAIGRRPAGILGAVIMIITTILAATAGRARVFLVFGAIQIAMLGWLWGVGDTYLSGDVPHEHPRQLLRDRVRWRPRHVDRRAVPGRRRDRRIRPDHAVPG